MKRIAVRVLAATLAVAFGWVLSVFLSLAYIATIFRRQESRSDSMRRHPSNTYSNPQDTWEWNHSFIEGD